jgi:3-oxoacyl-[acyl-carrier-protein] synthase II
MKRGRRVVITGLGVISPLGNTPEDLWQALSTGASGVAPLVNVPPDYLPTGFAAEARNFSGSIDDFGPLEGDLKKAIRKGLKVMCRESQMGVAAAQRALADARIAPGTLDPERGGVVFGSDYMMTEPTDFSAGIRRCLDDAGKFDFARWGDEGIPLVTPLWLLKYLPNMPASHIAIYNDLRGPNNSLTLREASSNAAVGEAFRTIARGSADMIVAGATGTRVHPMKIVHSIIQEEVANGDGDPARASRPFDLNRGGMVLGEGAGAIVLEELEAARARGATIHAEVVGTASSSVVTSNGVADRETALANVMTAALRDAEGAPQDLGHLHAHGLATRSCDEEEARAIRKVFGSHTDELPVTAAKSYFGNLGAASGLIEIVSSLLALRQGELFGVLNYETPDPACPLRVSSGTTRAGESFLHTNVTPQGQASAVMIRRIA